jgi:hypothetical protein
MPNRRDFCKTAAALMAGMFFQAPDPKRREVMIGNRRVKVIDVHGHFVIPEELDVVKGTNLAKRQHHWSLIMGDQRLRV